VIAVIAGLAGIDQAIKLWAIANLDGQPARPFLPLGSFDWMHLRYLENSGAAFSMLSGNRGFLIVFPCIMIAVCLYALHRMGKTHRWLYCALPLIAAGGLGNLIDRVFRSGRVVDYLDFQLCNFAVFNFADICVTIGVIVMLFGILFLEKEEPEAKKLKQAERIPYAPTVGTVPDLPAAGELPEAAAAPQREVLEVPEETDDAVS
jgi:signal peptidase II